MPDPTPQPGVSDGCGVAIVRVSEHWYYDKAYYSRGKPTPTHRAFPEAEAAALVRVARAAEVYARVDDYGNCPNEWDEMSSALRQLDAARSPA